MARRWMSAIALTLFGGLLACGRVPAVTIDDRDRDGLDDQLETRLAQKYLPAIHESPDDACRWPALRPVLFRARPSATGEIAITYVLLYALDCGPLGHIGDNESFTVWLSRQRDEWTVARAESVAHAGTAAERRSTGLGRAIWVSRDKHSIFATFEACADDEFIVDGCAENGPGPGDYAWLNVGERTAPMSDDVGDVMVAAGANPDRARRLAPWVSGAPAHATFTRLVDALSAPTASGTEVVDYTYLLFRGQRIWNHVPFLAAGDITAQFTRTSSGALSVKDDAW